jgi:hypothetical protein
MFDSCAAVPSFLLLQRVIKVFGAGAVASTFVLAAWLAW